MLLPPPKVAPPSLPVPSCFLTHHAPYRPPGPPVPLVPPHLPVPPSLPNLRLFAMVPTDSCGSVGRLLLLSLSRSPNSRASRIPSPLAMLLILATPEMLTMSIMSQMSQHSIPHQLHSPRQPHRPHQPHEHPAMRRTHPHPLMRWLSSHRSHPERSRPSPTCWRSFPGRPTALDVPTHETPHASRQAHRRTPLPLPHRTRPRPPDRPTDGAARQTATAHAARRRDRPLPLRS